MRRNLTATALALGMAAALAGCTKTPGTRPVDLRTEQDRFGNQGVIRWACTGPHDMQGELPVRRVRPGLTGTAFTGL